MPPEEKKEENPSENPPINKLEESLIKIEPPRPSQAERLESALAHNKEKLKNADIKSLKTYQSDVAEAIKRDNVSVIKMALAEKKRQEAQGLTSEAVSADKKRSMLFISLSGLLILAGLGVIGYFLIAHNYRPAFVLNVSRNIIYAEKNTELKLERADGGVLAGDFNKLKILHRPEYTIENLVVSEKNVGADINRELGARHAITGGRLIALLNTDIPAPLFRSIQALYMLGVYQGDYPETYLILKTDSYEEAFAGMLEWEKTLQRDMAGLFSLPEPTANFSDRIVNNRDTRIITNQEGKVIFLYSFLDPNTIVFTQGENSFREVLARYLRAQQEK